ncbi:MAG: FimB/Mfa2 family fimbrial subunit [Bacteroides sp.]
MKRFVFILKQKAILLLCSAVFAGAMASCNSILDFDEGDCTVEYRVKFKYDYNMKYANAFANEVNTITLYAFDKNGKFVYQRTEEGEPLKAEGYTMKIDVDPGVYHLVAWAGVSEKSFAVPLMTQGVSDIDELSVKTKRLLDQRTPDGAYVVPGDNYKLSPLWHAESQQTTFTRTGGRQQVATLSLTKNTNNIRIVLQQVGDKPIDVDQFNFSITDDNGWMDYHNQLLKDDMLKYLPFYRSSGTVNTRTRADGSKEVTSVAVAQITTARLIANKHSILHITNKETGKTVLAIPLIDYLLLTKSYEHVIEDQEYLDRQDEYAMTFFLDERDTWLNTTIVINGWTIRLNDTGL